MKVELLTGDDIVAGIRRVKLRFPGAFGLQGNIFMDQSITNVLF